MICLKGVIDSTYSKFDARRRNSDLIREWYDGGEITAEERRTLELHNRRACYVGMTAVYRKNLKRYTILDVDSFDSYLIDKPYKGQDSVWVESKDLLFI